MNNLLNIIIVLLIVGWLVGFIGFGAAVGSLIHILIVLAVIGIIYRLIAGRKGSMCKAPPGRRERSALLRLRA